MTMNLSFHKNLSLTKSISVLFILALLSIFLCLFFLKFIPQQQKEFNGRAFLELEQIETAFQNRNDGYTSAIKVFLGKMEAANPLCRSFRFSPALSYYPGQFITAQQMILRKNEDDNNWQITYPLRDTQGRTTYMFTNLDTVLQPIINTYRDIFEDYLVIRDTHLDASFQSMDPADSLHKGEIIFNSGNLSVDYLVNTDTLLKKNDGFSLINIHDVTIEGSPYKLFLFPFQAGKERIILAGLISLPAYTEGYKNMPFSMVTLTGVLVLLLLLHLPILKIYVLGIYERITAFNIRLIIGTYFIAAFLAFFLFSRIFLDHVQSVNNHDHLQDLSGQIRNAFRSEIDSMCTQLRKWDTTRAIREDATGLLAKILIPGNGPAPSRADSSRVDSLFYPTTYPYLDYLFWIDSAGKWMASWNTKKDFNRTPLLHVQDRDYFKDFIQRRFLTLPGNNATDSFTIQPTLGKFDGEYTITVVIPSRPAPDWKWQNAGGGKTMAPPLLIGLSGLMNFVNSPVLPYGYNFSIIDEQGAIKYDSKPGRALLSNILDESGDPAAISACIRYRNERYFSSFTLRGQRRALLVTPLPGLPYTLIVYADLSGTDEFQEHLIGLSAFFGIGILVLLILCALINEWARKRPGLLLSPSLHFFEWLHPTRNKEQYYLHLIKGMILLFGLYAGAWLIVELLPSQFEFTLVYISLLFPFYLALYYYLLRDRQKNGILTFPSLSLSVFLAVVIAFINLYAVCSTPTLGGFGLILLTTQGLFLGALIYFARLFNSGPSSAAGRWLRYYTWAIVTGVFLIGIIPTTGIFWLFFRQEIGLQANSIRINCAHAIDQRRIALNERASQYKAHVSNTPATYRDSLDRQHLHALKFQYGIYLPGGDTIDPAAPFRMTPSHSLAPEYNELHQRFFPGDSTVLTWTNYPDSAGDGSWHLIHSATSQWPGPLLLYSDGKDGIDADTLKWETGRLTSLSAVPLMMQESFSARLLYICLYFGSLLLTIFLVIRLTRSLAGRIFLLDLFQGSPCQTGQIQEPDQLIRTYADKDLPRSMQEINNYEKTLPEELPFSEENILCMLSKLDPIYHRIWTPLSPLEKFILYDFAIDGFANYKTGSVLNQLLQKGILIFEDGRLALMAPSFREYVLRQSGDAAIQSIIKKAREEGYWQMLKIPLLLLLAIPGIFIFLTQEALYQKMIGLFTAIGPILPLIQSLFEKDNSGNKS